MNQSLASEISNLCQRLQALAPGPSKKRKRNRKKKSVQPGFVPQSGGYAAQPVANPVVNRTPPKRRNRGGVPRAMSAAPDGSVRIRRREFIVVVKGSQSMSAAMDPVNYPWVAKIVNAFDRYTMHSLTVHFKTAVGATTDGLIAIGVDWDGHYSTSLLKREVVLALTPVMDGPIWQNMSMRLPQSKLMTRKEYSVKRDPNMDDIIDQSPGILLINVTSGSASKVMGEIWYDYDITLYGTQ